MRKLVWALFIGAAFLCPILSACAADAQERPEYLQTRPFMGQIRRDMAESAAHTAADIQALKQAARFLAQQSEVRLAAESGVDVPLTGLALMLYTTRLSATGIQGFPPHVVAVQGVTLVPPEDLRKSIITALGQREKLSLYSAAFALQEKYLAEYDTSAAAILAHPTGEEATAMEMAPVNQSIQHMKGLAAYIALLPTLEQHWADPEKTLKQLSAVQRTAPGNPLVLTAIGEVLLQLDRPAEALDAVYDALAAAPDLPRAHDIKGAILLRQRLPALAANAFSEAVRLSPHTPAYRIHRAAAYLVQEEIQKMCSDLREACVQGDCEDYTWAKSRAKCREENSDTPQGQIEKNQSGTEPHLEQPLTNANETSPEGVRVRQSLTNSTEQ